MSSLLNYGIQLVVASGLLYGYYHLFLRNKKFHFYNRYFILAAVVAAIVIPFFNIPVYFTKEETATFPFLEALTNFTVDGNGVTMANDALPPANKQFSFVDIFLFIYILLCVLLLARIVFSLARIFRLFKSHSVEKLDDISFINTVEPGTPFSFFRWLFWNREIELNSDKGQQVFRHELFHIKQRHSLDILFMELLTTIIWINPFFHLMKKELRAIHEFLADEAAVHKNEEWNYAELLLMQVLETKQFLVNPFFHNQIKRRIAMITSSQKPRHQYLRKIMVLPLLVMVTLLFAFSYRSINQDIAPTSIEIIPGTGSSQFQDTVVFITALDKPAKKSPTTDQLNEWKNGKIYGVWIDNKRISNDQLSGYKSGDFSQYTVSRLAKNTVNYGKHYYQVDLSTNSYFEKNYGLGSKRPMIVKNAVVGSSLNEPLASFSSAFIVIDNIEQPGFTVGQLEGHSLLKNKTKIFVRTLDEGTAIKKYGVKAKNGALEIFTTPEKGSLIYLQKAINEIPTVIQPGLSNVKEIQLEIGDSNPLIVIDGVVHSTFSDPKSKALLVSIDPSNITHINVLKNQIAITKYGDKAAGGVIEVFTNESKNRIITATEVNVPVTEKVIVEESMVVEEPVKVKEEVKPTEVVAVGQPLIDANKEIVVEGHQLNGANKEVEEVQQKIPTIKLQDLKVLTAHQLIQISPGTAILDFTITTEVDVDIKEVNNKGSDLNEASKKLLMKVRPGKILTIEKIRIVQDGAIKKIPGKVYQIVN